MKSDFVINFVFTAFLSVFLVYVGWTYNSFTRLESNYDTLKQEYDTKFSDLKWLNDKLWDHMCVHHHDVTDSTCKK